MIPFTQLTTCLILVCSKKMPVQNFNYPKTFTAKLFQQCTFILLFSLTTICAQATHRVTGIIALSNPSGKFIAAKATDTIPPIIGPIEALTSNLYLLDDSIATLADGNLAQYNSSFSAQVDRLDIPKLTNFNETFGLIREGVLLAIERRPIITNTDTLFYNLTRTTQRAYQLQLTASALNHPGLQGFFKDSYVGDSVALDLNGSNAINFNVDENPASQNPARFMVVFETLLEGGPLPVTFTSVKAAKRNNTIPVSWTVQNEVNIKSYVVQKSNDDKSFTDVATVTASGLTEYNWTDINEAMGNNYYRIHSVATDGAIQYSSVAKVNVAAENPVVTIYPNPATNGMIALQFTNMPEGIYTVKVLTTVGQVIAIKTINHTGGNASEVVALNDVAKGMYELEIVKPDDSIETHNIVYQ
jgi:hypothetical protein